MKKYIISFFVLAVLIIYSLGIRHQQPRISPPSSLTNNNSAALDTGSSGTHQNDSTSQGSTDSYKDGSYSGSAADAYYGEVQVRATVNGGKITNVKFLQYPDTHSTSVYINQQAMPYLQQEAVKAQSAHVNIVSGATYTSQAFIQSLSSALSQA